MMLISSRKEDHLVLKQFRSTVEDGSNLAFTVDIPDKPELLRRDDRISFIGIELEEDLPQVEGDQLAKIPYGPVQGRAHRTLPFLLASNCSNSRTNRPPIASAS